MDSLQLFAAAIAVALIWGALSYNKLVRRRNIANSAWAGIDVELTRRYDLIPNLVKVVKAAAAFEQNTLLEVVEARQHALDLRQSPAAARAVVEEQLTSSLDSLFAVAEDYPTLTATENFLRLQEELAETENRLAASRRFYNVSTAAYNSAIQTFPGLFFAMVWPSTFSPLTFFTIPQNYVATSPKVEGV